jgi:acyl carrier protein
MFELTQIVNELVSYVAESATPGGDIGPDTDLLDLGVLDSLLMMDLVMHVESRYRVRLNETEIAPRHFRSILSLARLVACKASRPCLAGSPA